MLLIRINRCIDRDDCLGDEEVKNFFRDRYLTFWLNGIRFDPSKFGEQSIIKRVKQTTLPISITNQIEYPYQVSRTELHLQDEFVNFDEVTELKDSTLFKSNPLFPRPYEFNDSSMIAVSIEYNPDLIVIERNITTILDLLADVGGLDTALATLSGILLALFNSSRLDNYMVSHLYLDKSQRTHDRRRDSEE